MSGLKLGRFTVQVQFLQDFPPKSLILKIEQISSLAFWWILEFSNPERVKKAIFEQSW